MKILKHILCITIIILVSSNLINASIFTNNSYGSFQLFNKNKKESADKRSAININFMPGYSYILPTALNLMGNKRTELFDFINVKIPNDTIEYLNVMQFKSSGFYIPNISYSVFISDRIAFEIGAGFSLSEYNLYATKEQTKDFINKKTRSSLSDIVTTNSYFKLNFNFIPVTIGLRFYGKTRTVFNSLKVGINTLIYDVETQNGITAIKTKRSIIDATVYVAYELGWSIELGKNKNWQVKPVIEISLFEIGYYVRPWAPNMYSSVTESFSAITAGLGLSSFIPNWKDLPSWAHPLANIRFAIFPRIGFSLRF